MAKRRNRSAKPASDDRLEADTAATTQNENAGEDASALEVATAVEPEKQTDAQAAGQEPGAPAPAPDSTNAESQGAAETEALSDGQADSGVSADTGTADPADEGSGSDAAGDPQRDGTSDADGVDETGRATADPENEALLGDEAAVGQAEACAEVDHEPWEPNILAAALAAAHAFAAGRREDSRFVHGVDFIGFDVNDDTFEESQLRSALQIAATFVRRWPESSAEAIVIHLRRRGFAGVQDPDRRSKTAWSVFIHTLIDLDACDNAEKAEAEAEARAAEKRQLLVDRDRLAMTPEDDSPFSQYGQAALRRPVSPEGEKPRKDQQ